MAKSLLSFRSFDGRYSLRFCLSLSVLLIGGVTVTILARESMLTLRLDKEKDLAAIVYLELEKLTGHLSAMIPDRANALAQKRRVYAEYRLSDDRGYLQWQAGGGRDKLTFEEIGFSDWGDLSISSASKNVVNIAGENYLLFVDNTIQSIEIISLQPQTWLGSLSNSSKDLLIYILNRSGVLVASTSADITKPNERPLVQRFVVNPLSQGQLRFTSGSGETIGFFKELSGTNLILFAEVDLAFVNESIWQIYRRIIAYSLIAVILGVLVLQWPLKCLLAPITSLGRATEDVRRGNFNLELPRNGATEFGKLTDSFSQMGKALLRRDENIKRFIAEEKKVAKKNGENCLVHRIQSYLNFESRSEGGDGVIEVAAHACDPLKSWYQYLYDEKGQESVLVLSDFSHHDAATKAILTAFIASALTSTKEHTDSSFPVESFLSGLNKTLMRSGNGDWQLPMFVLVLQEETRTISIYKAGYQNPTLFVSGDTSNSLKTIKSGGKPLGLADRVEYEPEDMAFENFAYLFSFSTETGAARGEFLERLVASVDLDLFKLDGEQQLSLIAKRLYELWGEADEGLKKPNDGGLIALKVAT